MEQEQINPNFDIPYYIFEEITEYIEETSQGKCKCMKWENIKRLLRLAVVNNRLTEKQAETLENDFCREIVKE